MTTRQTSGPIEIPDHRLLDCIGQGSYGEVWLGQNAMGTYRAIKIIRRCRFKQESPFLRELNGLRLYEPVSRSHPSLIDVLHIGPANPNEYFYYIMELGDDVAGLHPIDPDRYRPRTLAHELDINGRLPVGECVRVGMALSEALAHLHENGLIHRDIKPSNILYVEGVVKLADIGMVTGVLGAQSYVGTSGFIPPEGPSSLQADLFSLGKVLYEASTGNDRCEFPSLPRELHQWDEADAFLEFNEILIKACKDNPTERYKSARTMNADLVVVFSGQSVKRLRVLEMHWRRLRRVAPIAVALLVLMATLFVAISRDQARERLHQQRQVGSMVSRGTQMVDRMDFLGALPAFVSALQQDEGTREATHRLRVGSTLERCPRLLTMLFHSNEVTHVEFSPTGDSLLTVERDGKARFWNPRTGAPAGPVLDTPHGLTHGSFNPKGGHVVTAGLAQPVIVWDVHSGEPLHRIPHKQEVFSVNYSHDGTRIVSASLDGVARVFDAASGALLSSIVSPGTNSIRYASFSSDDSLVVSADEGKQAVVWNVDTGQSVSGLLHHTSWVVCAAFGRDNRFIATSGFGRKVRIWDWIDGRELLPQMLHQECVGSVVFSPNNHFLLSGSWDGTARIWNVEDHQPAPFANTFHHPRAVMSACFSPDGRLVATACIDGTVRIWDLAATTVSPEQLPTSTHFVGDALVHCDERGLRIDRGNDGSESIASDEPITMVAGNGTVIAGIYSGPDPKLLIWDTRHPAPKYGPFLLPDLPDEMACSSDGDYVAFSGRSGLWVIDCTNGTRIPISKDPVRQRSRLSVFSPNSRILFYASGNKVYAADLRNGAPLFQPLHHESKVNTLQVSSDGRRLVTGCQDNQLSELYAQQWDAHTGHPIGPKMKHFDGILHAAFSPDASMIATAGEDSVAVIWNARTGAPVARIRHANQVHCVGFSRNGEWIVAACADGTARVWDSSTGEAITPPFAHKDKLVSARFVRGDTHIGTIDRSGNRYLWPLNSDERPIASLVNLAVLFSGNRDGFLGDTQTDWRHLWESMNASHPEYFVVSEDQSAAWDRQFGTTSDNF